MSYKISPSLSDLPLLVWCSLFYPCCCKWLRLTLRRKPVAFLSPTGSTWVDSSPPFPPWYRPAWPWDFGTFHTCSHLRALLLLLLPRSPEIGHLWLVWLHVNIQIPGVSRTPGGPASPVTEAAAWFSSCCSSFPSVMMLTTCWFTKCPLTGQGALWDQIFQSSPWWPKGGLSVKYKTVWI